MRYEIRLAGAGGQGLVLAGIILAEAGLKEGHHVVHSQNYGPEARGGNSVSEVIFSSEPIDYPRTMGLDLLVALSQQACNENMAELKEGGLVIVDSTPVKKCLWGKVLRVPLQREADHTFNDSRVINMLSLGVLTPFCSWVTSDSVRQAIQQRMPKTLVDRNLEVYDAGFRRGQELLNSTTFHEMEDAIEV
jgi:2-oxoglutarate ferredoxin oxidoreductase subunit gamma